MGGRDWWFCFPSAPVIPITELLLQQKPEGGTGPQDLSLKSQKSRGVKRAPTPSSVQSRERSISVSHPSTSSQRRNYTPRDPAPARSESPNRPTHRGCPPSHHGVRAALTHHCCSSRPASPSSKHINPPLRTTSTVAAKRPTNTHHTPAPTWLTPHLTEVTPGPRQPEAQLSCPPNCLRRRNNSAPRLFNISQLCPYRSAPTYGG